MHRRRSAGGARRDTRDARIAVGHGRSLPLLVYDPAGGALAGVVRGDRGDRRGAAAATSSSRSPATATGRSSPPTVADEPHDVGLADARAPRRPSRAALDHRGEPVGDVQAHDRRPGLGRLHRGAALAGATSSSSRRRRRASQTAFRYLPREARSAATCGATRCGCARTRASSRRCSSAARRSPRQRRGGRARGRRGRRRAGAVVPRLHDRAAASSSAGRSTSPPTSARRSACTSAFTVTPPGPLNRAAGRDAAVGHDGRGHGRSRSCSARAIPTATR